MKNTQKAKAYIEEHGNIAYVGPDYVVALAPFPSYRSRLTGKTVSGGWKLGILHSWKEVRDWLGCKIPGACSSRRMNSQPRR